MTRPSRAARGTHVALIRGINVGRAKRVAMADLRELTEALGYRDARTLLNSGNVVFSAGREAPTRIAARIEAAMTERLAVSARVFVLTAAELATVITENKFGEVVTDPTRLFVAFCGDADRLAKVQPLTQQGWSPDAMAVGSKAAYLWCPKGMSQSLLAEAVGRVLGDSVTTRNWATVTKIQALLA